MNNKLSTSISICIILFYVLFDLLLYYGNVLQTSHRVGCCFDARKWRIRHVRVCAVFFCVCEERPILPYLTYDGQKYGTKIRRPVFLDRTSLISRCPREMMASPLPLFRGVNFVVFFWWWFTNEKVLQISIADKLCPERRLPQLGVYDIYLQLGVYLGPRWSFLQAVFLYRP
jgi:hypothetical protein